MLPLPARVGHPGPGDVPLVIEVADSSLARDGGLKPRVYARADIPNYGIVDLVDRRIEVHSEPTDQATHGRIASVGPDARRDRADDRRRRGRPDPRGGTLALSPSRRPIASGVGVLYNP